MFGPNISNEDFEMVFALCNSLKLAIIYLSPDKHIIRVNAITEALFKQPKNRMIGQSLNDFCKEYGIEPFAADVLLPNEHNTSSTTHWISDQFLEVYWNITPCVTQDEHSGFFLAGKIIATSLSSQPLKQIEEAIRALPVAIFSKDTTGSYAVVNEYQAQIAGFSNIKGMLGTTDFGTSWSQEAQYVQRSDERALKADQPIIFNEYLTLADGKKHVLYVTKSAFKDETGNLLGIIGTAIVSQNAHLNSFDPNFIIAGGDTSTYLSKKEIECIHWLIKGKSAAEVAIILKISRRTVETHLNNVKKKLNCYKLFQLGYLVGKYGYLLI